MTAWLFRQHRLDTGRHLAWAVICVQARYCALCTPATSTVLRRGLTERDWEAIQMELNDGLNSGPLPAAGPIARALTPDLSASVIAQYATALEVHGAVRNVAVELDAWLLGQPHP